MEPAAWGFLGTLVGVAASVFTTRFNSRNALEIHRLKSIDERAERARVFQRETLLAVQEAVQHLLRLMARANMSDIKAFRAGQAWMNNRLEATLDEEIGVANRQLTLLTERVADDELRDAVKTFHTNINSVVNARSADDAEEAIARVMLIVDSTMAQIGTALRTHY